MKAELRRLSWDDADVRIEDYVPSDPTDCCVNLVAAVGIRGGDDAADLFYLRVCTIRRLERELHSEPYDIGRGTLIVLAYDYPSVKAMIEAYIETCEGQTWPDVVRKIVRLADWEYG